MLRRLSLCLSCFLFAFTPIVIAQWLTTRADAGKTFCRLTTDDHILKSADAHTFTIEILHNLEIHMLNTQGKIRQVHTCCQLTEPHISTMLDYCLFKMGELKQVWYGKVHMAAAWWQKTNTEQATLPFPVHPKQVRPWQGDKPGKYWINNWQSTSPENIIPRRAANRLEIMQGVFIRDHIQNNFWMCNLNEKE